MIRIAASAVPRSLARHGSILECKLNESMNPPYFRVILFALALVFPVSAAAQESAQVAQGKKLYAEFCTLCHGVDGKRGEGFQTPIWGSGSLIASKFQNAQDLADYMILMPFNNPTVLDDAQKLAVVAYMLANHGSIPVTGEVTSPNAKTIPIK